MISKCIALTALISKNFYRLLKANITGLSLANNWNTKLLLTLFWNPNSDTIGPTFIWEVFTRVADPGGVNPDPTFKKKPDPTLEIVGKKTGYGRIPINKTPVLLFLDWYKSQYGWSWQYPTLKKNRIRPSATPGSSTLVFTVHWRPFCQTIQHPYTDILKYFDVNLLSYYRLTSLN